MDEINKAIEHAAASQLKGILGCDRPADVSIDFNHDPHSSTFDSTRRR